MSLFPFRKSGTAAPAEPQVNHALSGLVRGCSIEVMPRTAAKIPDLRQLLPRGTRIYIAHIEGVEIGDMVATARRISDEGFVAMPHIPARLVADRATLADWVARYRDAGVDQALLLAGGRAAPVGDFDNAMQLLESGAFTGFSRLHVAGHPEGNRAIDPDGSERMVMQAAAWKADFAQRSDAEMALVTQFSFDAGPVIAWIARLRAAGIDLPVHLGVAGPAKLQTLLKFALSCGIGPSVAVLQKRARDISRLLLPYTPDDFLQAIAAHKAEQPDCGIAQLHFFPLGGISASADWIRQQLSPGE